MFLINHDTDYDTSYYRYRTEDQIQEDFETTGGWFGIIDVLCEVKKKINAEIFDTKQNKVD